MTTMKMTVRIKSRLGKRLEKLAKATNRSKSFLIAEAMKKYFNQQEWPATEMQRGLAKADTDQLMGHGEIKRLWKYKDQKNIS